MTEALLVVAVLIMAGCFAAGWAARGEMYAESRIRRLAGEPAELRPRSHPVEASYGAAERPAAPQAPVTVHVHIAAPQLPTAIPVQYPVLNGEVLTTGWEGPR